MVHFGCVIGDSVEVRTKNIQYWIIDGQPHFGMPRGAKMSLTLNEPNSLLFIEF